MNPSTDRSRAARRRSTLLAAVFVLFGSLSLVRPALSACATDGPESVLRCLQKAYAERDVRVIEELLASDFVFKIGSRGSPKDRAWDLMVYSKFFGDTTMHNLTLEFAPSYRIDPGDIEATWIIDSLTVITRYDSNKGGNPRHYDLATQNNRIKVRLVEEPKPHYEIFHWLQPFTRK
jgi:hypothetical protein